MSDTVHYRVCGDVHHISKDKIINVEAVPGDVGELATLSFISSILRDDVVRSLLLFFYDERLKLSKVRHTNTIGDYISGGVTSVPIPLSRCFFRRF